MLFLCPCPSCFGGLALWPSRKRALAEIVRLALYTITSVTESRNAEVTDGVVFALLARKRWAKPFTDKIADRRRRPNEPREAACQSG
jgi:hypothetical protein